MHLRKLEPQEVEAHRAVRLLALGDSPDSFGERFGEVAERPLSYWQDLTHKVTAPGMDVMFVAWDAEVPIGCAYGLVDRTCSGVGRVGGMWVEPSKRHSGIGKALLHQVTEWARGRDFDRVALWAPAHRPEALALYRNAGFRDTGAESTLPSTPGLGIVEMDLCLNPNATTAATELTEAA